MYNLRNVSKQKILLEQERRIFRASDLSVLWGIQNRNTLFTTIKRYTQKQILYRIQKGLYATVPLHKLDRYEIGCAVAGSLSYVSMATVLQNEGIIMQSVNKITLLGRKELEFTVSGVEYVCKYLNPKYLINRVGIVDSVRYSIATPERAIADILHVSPKYHFDNTMAVEKLDINKISKEIGYT